MNVGDRERRVIVELLRDEADYWRDYHKGDDTSCMSDSCFTESILEAFGFDGAAVPVYELFDKLANLIDLPTCRLDLTDVETRGNAKVRIWECGRCGRTCEDVYGDYERCPHCGAMVLEKEDER